MGELRVGLSSTAVKWSLLVFFQLYCGPTTVLGSRFHNYAIIEQPSEIHKEEVGVPPKSHLVSGMACGSFLELVVDHALRRWEKKFQEPVELKDISNAVFQLVKPKLFGVASITRTCPLHLRAMELWRKQDPGAPNADVDIPSWAVRRDTKIGDILRLTVCLALPERLSLLGELTTYILWNVYGPEMVDISITNISISANISLRISLDGELRIALDSMQIQQIEKIEIKNQDSLGQTEQTGLVNNYGGFLTWLIEGPLYAPLVIILEGFLRDSVTGIFKTLDEYL